MPSASCATVVFAADVAKIDRLTESTAKCGRLFVEIAQIRVLDAIFALHLLDEQFAVAVDDDAVMIAEFQSVFQGANDARYSA